MRYKEPFTVYPRKLKKITVFYYQCYDSNGKRLCGHSTGQRTKTAAMNYCMELYRKGALMPDNKIIYFAQFANGWWDTKTCKYLEWRQLQNPLSPSTIDHYKTNLELHIKPFFGAMKMGDITQEHIQNWIMDRFQKGYANSSINILIATLKVMMKEAVRLKLISSNPAEKIKKLTAHNKEVHIPSMREAQKLFHCNWRGIWDSYDIYLLNKLAACTGMRLGEITGLQSEHVHPGYIHVCLQYSKKYGLRPLKTKDSRDIPITSFLYSELINMIGQNKGFVFSLKNGREPVARNKVYKETGKAFEKIGISRKEQKDRRIAVHHWRHFLNTALLMANVSALKVQKVTGHKSLSMTMHYTHFDSREFTEVLDVQNNLLSG